MGHLLVSCILREVHRVQVVVLIFAEVIKKYSCFFKRNLHGICIYFSNIGSVTEMRVALVLVHHPSAAVSILLTAIPTTVEMIKVSRSGLSLPQYVG